MGNFERVVYFWRPTVSSPSNFPSSVALRRALRCQQPLNATTINLFAMLRDENSQFRRRLCTTVSLVARPFLPVNQFLYTLLTLHSSFLSFVPNQNQRL